MHGKSRPTPELMAHLRKASPMTCNVDLADSPNSLDVRAMAEMVNRQINKAFNCNHMMGVDRASPGGDKSVEVTIKDGVIVKTREL